MQDLVKMMTHTLRMDVGDTVAAIEKSRLDSSALPEFKLNRRYRDTLVLHGKACHKAEDLSLGEIPKGWTISSNNCENIFFKCTAQSFILCLAYEVTVITLTLVIFLPLKRFNIRYSQDKENHRKFADRCFKRPGYPAFGQGPGNHG